MPLSRALLPCAALLIGAFIVLIGNGLQGMIVPVRAALEHFATAEIGLLSSTYSGGFVVSCLVTPYLLRRVGHIRTFAVMAALAACVALLLVLIIDPWVWIALRIVTGFCFAGLFMVIESWLNAVASNDVRGQLFSTYMVINLAAIMLGQMLLPLADPMGFGTFAVIAIAITFALVPVSLTTSQAPTVLNRVRLRLGHLYAVSPVGVSGCFLVGMANGAVGGLGAIYAQRLGFSLAEVALFMSAGILGGALGQMPIGRLSDRVDRRAVLLGVCLAAAVVGIMLAVIGGLGAGGGTVLGWDVPVLLVISGYGAQGAFIFSMYGLCVAHTNDFAAPEDFVETSSGLLLTYGIGAIAGPVFAAFLMDRIGTGALFAWTTAVQVALAAFTAYRMTRRARPAEADRTNFVVTGGVGQRTSPALAVLDPRAGEPPPAEPRSAAQPAPAQ